MSKVKTKSILLKIKLDGNGIVNFDSSEQKFMWNNLLGKTKGFLKNENNSFAKKNWYMDDDGNSSYKLKISSNALRHEIFKSAMPFHSPNIIHVPELLLQTIATPDALLRGYVFTNRGGVSIKRSSALTITGAEQISNTVSSFELCTRSGEKKVKDVDDKEAGKDTTLFNKETCGNIEYVSEGVIDLSKLQFISLDQIADRMAVSPEQKEIFIKKLSKKIPKLDIKYGFFKIKDSIFSLPELGLLFSSENINFLVKHLLKLMLGLNITKANGYAKIGKLEYKYVNDPIEDKMSNEDGWIELKSLEDVDKMDFDSEIFFEEFDCEEAEKIREEYELEVKNAEANSKEAKEKEKRVKAMFFIVNNTEKTKEDLDNLDLKELNINIKEIKDRKKVIIKNILNDESNNINISDLNKLRLRELIQVEELNN